MEAGQEVKWISQSQGSITEKKGIIIVEIPAGESAMSRVPKGTKRSHIKFGDVSKNDRVLVAVPAGKNGRIMHYYCPFKRMLDSQEV